MINAAISGRTPEMRMTVHLCRGNFKSMWIASGGYEPVADVLFNRLEFRRLLHGVGHRPRRRIRAVATGAPRISWWCWASSPQKTANSKTKIS